MGSVLGIARLGADLDFHIVVLKDVVMDDKEDVNEFLLGRVYPSLLMLLRLRMLVAPFK